MREVEDNASLNALVVAQAIITTLEQELEAATNALQACEKSRDDFKASFKMLTKDVFIRHGQDCVKPGFEHYRKLFLETEGDYFNLKRAFNVARIFNVLVANDLTDQEISESINELHFFKFPEFTPTFLCGLKAEIGIYKAAIRETSARDGTDADFWKHCPGAEKYDKALAKKNSGNDDLIIRTWRDNPIEKARRIWEWWKVHKDRFVFSPMLYASLFLYKSLAVL